MSFRRSLIISFVFVIWPAGGSFAAVKLSPQDVVDAVLTKSIEKLNIDNDRILKNEDLFTALETFDWGLQSEVNYESAERNPIGPFENEKDEILNASLEFGKTFRTGTQSSLKYSRESTRSELNSFLIQANQLSSRTFDFVTLEVMQPLLNNFWGGVDHRRERIQRALAKNFDKERLESLEELIVDSLTDYWKTYAASKALTASLASRDRYQNLVKVVERKKRLGFALPGELYQIKAEYESQKRRVKESSRQYLIALDTMFRRLRQDRAEDLEFDLDEESPLFPDLSPIAIEELRPLQIAKQKIYASTLSKKATESATVPELNLTGRLAYRGADENALEAQADLGSFNSPIYYVGVEFRTVIGSEAQDGSLQLARVRLEQAKLNHEKLKLELKDQLKASELTAKNAFQNVQSAREIVNFRKQALTQIESAYKQGRRDLTEVITANTRLFEAQTQLANDISDYNIALNELLNKRDSLIPQFTQVGAVQK